MKNDLNGAYIGIVIDKNDPAYLGRVQVFIPSLDFSLSNNLKGQSTYVFPGNDTDGDFNIRELKLLKNSCIWAFVQQPIFGGGSLGRLDEETGKTTVSDSASETKAFKFDGTNAGSRSYGSKFNYYGARQDAFANPEITMTRRGNFNGLDYFPENYINAPKGFFSLPEVGTKVLVTFLGGSKNQAIITGKVPFARENQLILE